MLQESRYVRSEPRWKHTLSFYSVGISHHDPHSIVVFKFIGSFTGQNYTKAIDEYKKTIYEIENPDPEKLRLEKEERDRIDREAFAKQQAEWEERKKNEIHEIARSWAKREYFRKSMSGNMGMTEEEYIESVWERAMFEGDLKYRMMHGMQTDERKETQEFEEKQARKKEAALKRAREALEGVGTISEGEGKVKKVPDDDDEDDDE